MKFFKYYFYYIRLKMLEDKISSNYMGIDFNKTKRLTLWYLGSKNLGYVDSIDYAFYKVYFLWGIDSLTESEKKGF